MRQDWDVKEIVLGNKAPFETVTGNLKVKLVELGEERYIVCLNEEEAKRDQAVREEIVSDLREKIAKGPRKMIGNIGYRRYLSVDKDAVQIDEKKIASEKKFDGIYVLRTNADLSAKDAALAYKGLLLPCVLSSGCVPSDRSRGGETQRAAGPLHAANRTDCKPRANKHGRALSSSG